MVGRVANADAGTGRQCAVCDDLLATSYDKSESAVAAVESPAAILYPQRPKRKDQAMEDSAVVHDCIVRHWPNLPSLCRGNDDCGTIFAVEV